MELSLIKRKDVKEGGDNLVYFWIHPLLQSWMRDHLEDGVVQKVAATRMTNHDGRQRIGEVHATELVLSTLPVGYLSGYPSDWAYQRQITPHLELCRNYALVRASTSDELSIMEKARVAKSFIDFGSLDYQWRNHTLSFEMCRIAMEMYDKLEMSSDKGIIFGKRLAFLLVLKLATAVEVLTPCTERKAMLSYEEARPGGMIGTVDRLVCLNYRLFDRSSEELVHFITSEALYIKARVYLRWYDSPEQALLNLQELEPLFRISLVSEMNMDCKAIFLVAYNDVSANYHGLMLEILTNLNHEENKYRVCVHLLLRTYLQQVRKGSAASGTPANSPEVIALEVCGEGVEFSYFLLDDFGLHEEANRLFYWAASLLLSNCCNISDFIKGQVKDEEFQMTFKALDLEEYSSEFIASFRSGKGAEAIKAKLDGVLKPRISSYGPMSTTETTSGLVLPKGGILRSLPDEIRFPVVMRGEKDSGVRIGEDPGFPVDDAKRLEMDLEYIRILAREWLDYFEEHWKP